MGASQPAKATVYAVLVMKADPIRAMQLVNQHITGTAAITIRKWAHSDSRIRLTIQPSELFLADGRPSVTEQSLRDTERASDTMGMLTDLMESKKAERLEEGLKNSGYGSRIAAQAARISELKDQMEAAELEEALEQIKARIKAKKAAAPEHERSDKPDHPSPTKKARDTIDIAITYQGGAECQELQVEVGDVPPAEGQHPNLVDLIKHLLDLRLFPSDWGLQRETIFDHEEMFTKYPDSEGFQH